MIIRAPRPESFFYVLDKRISEDKRLSWSARGMLVYLLGKPDNWRVSVSALVNETQVSRKQSGRDAVYAILGELIEAGYVVREEEKEDGKFSGMRYVVKEDCGEKSPLTDFPDTDYTDTSNPTLISNEVKVSKEVNKQAASPVGFAEFWTAYPRKKGKAEAEKAFAKAIKLTDLDTLLLAIKLQSSELKWHDKANERYIPHPATWLNARRWEDSAPQKPADPSVPHEGWINARGKPAIRFWGEWRDPDGIDPKSGDCWSLVKFTHEKCIYPGRDCSEPIGE